MFPDTILYNGNIITLNERRPHASALAIYGERITFVGPDEPTLLQAGSRTRQINLNGKTVVPGFCDSHIHLVWFGMNLLTQADLIGSESMSEVLERLADIAAKSAGWIRGHGFDQSKLTEGQFPTRQQLDTVSADRPIVIAASQYLLQRSRCGRAEIYEGEHRCRQRHARIRADPLDVDDDE